MGRQTTGVTWLTCTKRFSIGLVKRASYTLISFVTVICIFEIFNVNSVSSLNEPFRLLEQIVLINIVYKKKNKIRDVLCSDAFPALLSLKKERCPELP